MTAVAAEETIRLTQFTNCAGCASKMGAGDLSEALGALPTRTDPRLVVGRETFDDAGIFRISDDVALVQTVDFFAPIVDDPYEYGQIAAANALSDVYAMGGQPLTALNIMSFPAADIPLAVMTEILRGGQDKVHEASAFIVGGHTVLGELKYGLSVTGQAHPSFLLTNAGAKPGDRLILTKPIGTGILTTAAKRQLIAREDMLDALEAMKRLNGSASRAALAVGARCATDITGFSLLGHASHIARASAVTIHIDVASVPLFANARAALLKGGSNDGAKRNRQYLGELVDRGSSSDEDFAILTDPQTSGGLLVAVPAAKAAAYLARVQGAVEIGEVQPEGTRAIVLA
ncbi:MAG: selenide, water dikinase SelD [Gemmatimonadaceae bacterium]|nr:selenide, water dikinase SelD [Gemmatimonadaceae bacterium]